MQVEDFSWCRPRVSLTSTVSSLNPGILNWKRETALHFHFPSHTKNLNSLFHLHLKVSGRLK